jgi:hypothetical protein
MMVIWNRLGKVMNTGLSLVVGKNSFETQICRLCGTPPSKTTPKWTLRQKRFYFWNPYWKCLKLRYFYGKCIPYLGLAASRLFLCWWRANLRSNLTKINKKQAISGLISQCFSFIEFNLYLADSKANQKKIGEKKKKKLLFFLSGHFKEILGIFYGIFWASTWVPSGRKITNLTS